MKISLKKALKLRKELEASVTKFELPMTTFVSLHVQDNVKDPTTVLTEARTKLQSRIDQFTFLSDLLANLRTAIAVTNSVEGIEALLAGIAGHDRAIGLMRRLVATPVTPPLDELQSELAMKYKDFSDPEIRRNPYGNESKVGVPVLNTESQSQAEREIIRLKRAREDLEDQRTGKNASTKIEIADEDAEKLRLLGLL